MPENSTNIENKQLTLTSDFSLIPIGFGLEGYQIKNNSINATGADGTVLGEGGANGTISAWNDIGYDEDRWVSDKDLKQVVMQCTFYQSVPLKYSNGGDITYLNLLDGIDRWDYTGEAAYSTCIGGTIADDMRSVNDWANKLNGRDFDAGCAICATTLAHYLNHFYGMSETTQTARKLLSKRIVNAEVLYNIGTGQGKAFRLKVVDTTGDVGYKGGGNNCKGQVVVYDVLDNNMSVLLTRGFEDVIRWNSNLGLVNGGTLDFPWKDVVYDYKTGTIPGYNPNAIKEWTSRSFGKLDIKADSCGVWSSKSDNGHRQPIARVRFFVDESDLGTARSVMPNLPDEFSKCNYENGAISAMTGGINLDGYSSVGSAIYDMAMKISNWCQQDSAAKGKWTYSKDASDGASNAARPATYLSQYGWKYEPVSGVQWKMCCGSYVWWVLAELGITKGGSVYGSRAAEMNPDNVQKNLASGYKAISVGRDTANLQQGDILVFGLNGNSHTAIYDKMSGAKIVEYGMGATKWMSGSYTGSHAGRDQSSLKDIIRIVKADGSDSNNSSLA